MLSRGSLRRLITWSTAPRKTWASSRKRTKNTVPLLHRRLWEKTKVFVHRMYGRRPLFSPTVSTVDPRIDVPCTFAMGTPSYARVLRQKVVLQLCPWVCHPC